jgi:hypothetical protein
MDRLIAIKGSLTEIHHALQQLLNKQNPLSALAPAALAPVLGSDFSTLHPAAKTVLRPNPVAVLNSDQMQGQMFLHSFLTYLRLVPEAFMTDGRISEEKLVRFTMSFMANNAATHWAKRHSSAIPFPFPTWAGFKAEFCLCFLEENKQDQALAKLESHSYFQGSCDVYR